MAREARAPQLTWSAAQRLQMPDGGTVSIQWRWSGADETAPTLVLLPTITGDGHDLRGLVRMMHSQLGWPVAVCNRRGHADPLTAPRFNTLGNTEDLRAQLEAIQARRPQAPIYAIGMSAGSGLLVRYLGEAGDRSLIRAGIIFCPAYDIEEAFGQSHPVYSAIMARRLSAYFLKRHREHLASVDGYARLLRARNLVEFHERLYPLAGFESRDEYFLASNPMVVAHRMTVPVLVINAEDDPVCSIHQVQRHGVPLSQQLEGAILAVTARGSHCAFFEGRLAQRSWAHQVMVEYLSAVYRAQSSR